MHCTALQLIFCHFSFHFRSRKMYDLLGFSYGLNFYVKPKDSFADGFQFFGSFDF